MSVERDFVRKSEIKDTHVGIRGSGEGRLEYLLCHSVGTVKRESTVMVRSEKGRRKEEEYKTFVVIEQLFISKEEELSCDKEHSFISVHCKLYLFCMNQ